jgi:uncharacterized membrane protein YhhN
MRGFDAFASIGLLFFGIGLALSAFADLFMPENPKVAVFCGFALASALYLAIFWPKIKTLLPPR